MHQIFVVSRFSAGDTFGLPDFGAILLRIGSAMSLSFRVARTDVVALTDLR